MIKYDKTRCSVEIDLKKFHQNYHTIKQLIPSNCLFMTVLKGNAYGHGLKRITQELSCYSTDWIAVATLDEALVVRSVDKKKNILILGYTNPEFAIVLARNNITQALISYSYAIKLNRVAFKNHVVVPCHLAIDTGMSRIGLLAYGEDYQNTLIKSQELYQKKNLHITGIFTHFSSAYSLAKPDDAYTKLQYQRFIQLCNTLTSKHIKLGLRHCNNSPSILNYPEFSLDMCRGGTLLFGLFAKESMRHPIDLSIVMKLKTVVTMIKTVPDGAGISYNRTAIAHKLTKLAVLSIGWYDGYPRLLGNKGRVLIRGNLYPIIGKVCMDICMADITGNTTIQTGDEAVLLGRQEDAEITCKQLYEPIGLGPGSISSGISERVPRIYV